MLQAENTKISSLIRVTLFVMGTFTISVLLMYSFIPSASGIFDEDHLVENLAVVCYFTCFITGIVIISSVRKLRSKRLLFTIPLIGLFGFLDELSYGQRLFDKKMPEIYGIEIDALHDFLQLEKSLIKFNWCLFCGVAALFVVLLILVLIFRRNEALCCRIRKNAAKIILIMITMASGALLVYILFGHVLVKSMYEGRSISFLNNFIVSQDKHSLSFYYYKADKLVFSAFMHVFFFLIIFGIMRFFTNPALYKKYPAFIFIVIAFGLLIVATMIDLFYSVGWIVVIEELCETNAALNLVSASIAMSCTTCCCAQN